MFKRNRSARPFKSRVRHECADEPIDLGFAVASVTRSSRRKTIGINIRDALVYVRAPKNMSRKRIELFVFDNKKWIKAKLDEQLAAFESVIRPLWEGGNSVLFDGDEIEVERVIGAKKIERIGERIIVPSEVNESALKKAVQKWYKYEFEKMLDRELPYYSEKMAMDYKAVQIRGFKSRWGSCSKNKELQFNWLLVLVPAKVRHYVIVHELAHIKVFDHSPKYWQLVEKYWPNWRIERDWLRAHQGGLQRYL